MDYLQRGTDAYRYRIAKACLKGVRERHKSTRSFAAPLGQFLVAQRFMMDRKPLLESSFFKGVFVSHLSFFSMGTGDLGFSWLKVVLVQPKVASYLLVVFICLHLTGKACLTARKKSHPRQKICLKNEKRILQQYWQRGGAGYFPGDDQNRRNDHCNHCARSL